MGVLEHRAASSQTHPLPRLARPVGTHFPARRLDRLLEGSPRKLSPFALPEHSCQGGALPTGQAGRQFQQQGKGRRSGIVVSGTGFRSAFGAKMRFLRRNWRVVRLLSGVSLVHVLMCLPMSEDEQSPHFQALSRHRSSRVDSVQFLSASFCASSARRRPAARSKSASVICR